MPTWRFSGGTWRPGLATSLPLIRIRPAATGSNPAMQRRTVVLPQPLAPSRQPICPRASENDRSSNTPTAP